MIIDKYREYFYNPTYTSILIIKAMKDRVRYSPSTREKSPRLQGVSDEG